MEKYKEKCHENSNYFWAVLLAAVWLGQASWPSSALDSATDLVQCRPATGETADNWTSVFLSRKNDHMDFGFAEVLR